MSVFVPKKKQQSRQRAGQSEAKTSTTKSSKSGRVRQAKQTQRSSAKPSPASRRGGKRVEQESNVRGRVGSDAKPSTSKEEAVEHIKSSVGRGKGLEKQTLIKEPNKQELPSKPYFVDVDEEHDGQRLDNFLITHLKGVPKTHVYRIIRKGEIRINKGRVKQTTRLKQGDSIRIPPIRLSESNLGDLDGARYAFLNKAILFEDEGLLVLNKPSGMAVHAGSGIQVGVIEAIRALRTDLKYIELVHRLDRETSGCLVLAKKSSVLKALHEDFKNNSLKNPRLDKRYICLVKGEWQGGQRRVIKALNTNAQRGGERMVMVDDNGSYASSIIRPLSTSEAASVLEVKLLTGRTHQVRVHSLSEGHPLAGDQKYGEREFNKKMKVHGLSRLFLHAAQLTFYHPMTEAKMTVEAPLPSELSSVLSRLELSGLA